MFQHVVTGIRLVSELVSIGFEITQKTSFQSLWKLLEPPVEIWFSLLEKPPRKPKRKNRKTYGNS